MRLGHKSQTSCRIMTKASAKNEEKTRPREQETCWIADSSGVELPLQRVTSWADVYAGLYHGLIGLCDILGYWVFVLNLHQCFHFIIL